MEKNKIIVGTRGWVNTWKSEENYKVLRRENERLKLSIEDGIRNYGLEKEIIAFIHYPPFYKEKDVPEEINFIETIKKYNIKRCYYAHLHGKSIEEAVEGKIEGREMKLVSADALNFKLLRI